eukprot:GGOE01018907.1.p3 GENE.GGOE01018907.1~~GGOE01018907.1.p3  ORF type:complete len:106 (-),score=12.31 GGOE01018907.1:337-654(-)
MHSNPPDIPRHWLGSVCCWDKQEPCLWMCITKRRSTANVVNAIGAAAVLVQHAPLINHFAIHANVPFTMCTATINIMLASGSHFLAMLHFFVKCGGASIGRTSPC